MSRLTFFAQQLHCCRPVSWPSLLRVPRPYLTPPRTTPALLRPYFLSGSFTPPHHTTSSSIRSRPFTMGNPSNVTITYSLPGQSPCTETFDLLVVACDPRVLPLAQRAPLEKLVNDELTSFTFRTSLYKAKRPDQPQIPLEGGGSRVDKPNFCVRFNPGPLSKLDGQVYGFRDEVMARDPNYEPSSNNITWCTSYQLEGKPLLNRDPEKAAEMFNKKRDEVVNNPTANRWIDFIPDHAEKKQPEVEEIVDYFAHFDPPGLEKHLPWKIRRAQGENNTLYVSSFTCFESVLHIYLYEEEIMKPGGIVMENRFPKDKNAKIAVVGAGPAGLLFASQHLQKKGYTNYKILEKSERFGGKTMTHRRPAPDDPSREVPCELGTCYLSLGYEPMFHLFPKYDAGKIVELDRDGFPFRSVVDPEVANTKQEREDGVEYGEWILRKNGRFKVIEQIQMVIAGIRYLAVHYATMGMTMNDCMPVEPPTELNVLDNLSRLIGLAKDRGDDDEEHGTEVRAKDVYSVLKDEKRDKDESALEPRGLFDLIDGFDDAIMDNIEDWIEIDDLKKACKSVLNTPFAKFLDDNKMDELKSVFIYGYQVQGYGTIELIPAYYGLIWMTPAVLTGGIRQLFSNDPAARRRGTVNVVTEGWLKLWEQIVAKDLKGKIIFNADITKIERKMTA